MWLCLPGPLEDDYEDTMEEVLALRELASIQQLAPAGLLQIGALHPVVAVKILRDVQRQSQVQNAGELHATIRWLEKMVQTLLKSINGLVKAMESFGPMDTGDGSSDGPGGDSP